jgi:signal transduction histidine kinase/CheY-like chemotaxis protein
MESISNTIMPVKSSYNSIIYLLFLCFFLFLLVSCTYFPSEKIIAQNGIMDLSSIDIESVGPLKLKGEWEFYWELLLEPEDFKEDNILNQKSGLMTAPGLWTGNIYNDTELPAFGYATYRLIIKPGNNTGSFGLYAPDQGTAFRLYCNGKLLASNGKVGNSDSESKPGYDRQIAFFENATEPIELICQISNFDYRKGGMWYGIVFGTEKQIINFQYDRFFYELFLLGIIFITMIYHFSLFILRKEDRSPLYFGLFCLAIILRLLVVGEKIITKLIPGFNWELLIKIEYCSFPLAILFFSLFIFTVFPKETIKRVLTAVNTVLLACCLFILVSPAKISNNIIPLLEVIGILYIIYFIYISIRAITNSKQEALIFLSGLLFITLTFANDILHANEILNFGYLLPFGLFGFIFAQSLLISIRFSNAFKMVKKLNESLKKIDRLKNEFLDNTSHELKTPLNVIHSIINLFKKTELNNEQSDYLKIIKSSSLLLSNLLNDILDISRIRIGQIQINKLSFNINEILIEVTESMKILATQKGLKLELNNNCSINYYLIGDYLRLKQILINLITNSIKYTETGIIELTVKEKQEKPEKLKICFTIKDTGIGIPEDKINKIFAPYIQLEDIKTDSTEGIGLGLAITQKLILLMNGSITVSSREGYGSEFNILLPFIKGEYISELSNKHKDNKGKKIHKVLVAEDNFLNQLFLKELMEDNDLNAATASNGKEVLDKYNSGNYSLILMDVNMPVMDGCNATRQIREQEKALNKHIPIIAITAYSSKKIIERCFNSGMDDYVLKPIEENSIIKKVNYWLNKADM